MKLRMFSAFFLLSCALCTTAQNNEDHGKDIPNYYLTIDEVADSYKLLPPPPAENSAHFAYDKEQYERGKALRNTPRGERAIKDALWGNDYLSEDFSEAFGMEISLDNTPEIFTLMVHMKEDAGDLSTRHAKQHYMRKRPFAYFNEPTQLPEEEKVLANNGSFPSGHTAIGWAVALVLAEVNPDRQDEILKRGYDMGQSRVISGFHYQSDVDAGRLVAAGVVARLHTNKAFCKQLKKAKKELKRLTKQ